MADRLHRVVMRRMLEDVVTGVYPPDEALPNEVELAGSYGVSRGVTRESIRALEERGVLAVTHGRGQVVQPEDRWCMADADVLLTLARLGIHTSLVSEAVEARVEFEAPAARRAASSSAAAGALRAALSGLEQVRPFRVHPRSADDPPVVADVAFHRQLMAWSGNRVASAMVASLHLPIAVMRHESLPDKDDPAHKYAERLVKAIEAGDAEAAEGAVRAHGRQLSRWLRAAAR